MNFLTATEVQTITDLIEGPRYTKPGIKWIGCGGLALLTGGFVGATQGRKGVRCTVEEAVAFCNGDLVLLMNGKLRAATASERAENTRNFFPDFRLQGDALLDFAIALAEKGATDVRAIRAELRAAGLPLKTVTIRALLDTVATIA